MSEKKRKGDIAEQAVALVAAKRGWDVLWPVGDRLPYDLVLDVEGRFHRLQVRATWAGRRGWQYVDFRRGPTRERFELTAIDFAVAVVLGDVDEFYVLPVAAAAAIPGHVRVADERVAVYRDAWSQIG